MEPTLALVYPPQGHQTASEALLIIGRAPAGSEVYVVGGPRLRAAANGFFAERVPVPVGAHTLTIEARRAGSADLLARTELSVTRQGPKPALPPSPLQADPASLTPQGRVALAPGERLTVGVLASPGASGRLSLPGQESSAAALATGSRPPSGQKPVFGELHTVGRGLPASGWLQGVLQVPLTSPERPPQPVTLSLSREGATAASVSLPLQVAVWAHPRSARVRSDKTVFRVEPVDGARLTPLRAGTLVQATGERSGWVRVALTEGSAGWVAAKDLQWLPAPLAPRVSLPLIQVRQPAARVWQIRMPLAERVPAVVTAEADALTLNLYGLYAVCDTIDGLPESGGLQVVCRQAGHQHVAVRVGCPRLAGYQLSDDLTLTVLERATSLAGARILLDPGHGGTEPGSRAPDGTPEKIMNLRLTQAVAERLEAAGATVRLTRTGDATVELPERSELAASWRPDAVISLHHNALPDGADPWAAWGPGCYYYHPFAAGLAQALQAELHAALYPGLPLGGRSGVMFNNLHLTRIYDAPSVLVELGFLTHPEEAGRLLSADTVARSAGAIVKGVSAWLAA